MFRLLGLLSLLTVGGSICAMGKLGPQDGKNEDKIQIIIDGKIYDMQRACFMFEGGIEKFRLPITFKNMNYLEFAQLLGRTRYAGGIRLRPDGDSVQVIEDSWYAQTASSQPVARRAPTRENDVSACTPIASALGFAGLMIYFVFMPYFMGYYGVR